MSTFISYIAVIGALASNLPYVRSAKIQRRLSHAAGPSPPPNLFEYIDTNKDSKLDKKEVTAFVEEEYGEELPPGVFEDEDKDGDGFITWDEFGGPEGGDDPTESPPLPNVFEQFDTNKDSKLDKDEVAAFFKEQGQDEVPPLFWEIEDKDKDGIVTWDEFEGPKGGSAEHPAESPASGAFGDPHIKTWTGKTYDFHGVCDLVLFSNPSFDNGSGVDVHIRNKRMSIWSFIESSAIRIGKDTFELTGGKDNDNFLINGIVQKRKNKNGVVGSISGFDIKFTQVNENSRKFMINLGTNKNNKNVEQIIFTTWKSFVSVSVKNPTRDHFDGSLGLMGSFPAGVMVARDGKTVLDDSNEFGQEWQVLNTEPEIFAERGTVGPNDMCSSPSSIEMRRRLQASVVTLKEAENACNSVNKEMKDLCMFDVMATNDKSSSGAY